MEGGHFSSGAPRNPTNTALRYHPGPLERAAGTLHQTSHLGPSGLCFTTEACHTGFLSCQMLIISPQHTLRCKNDELVGMTALGQLKALCTNEREHFSPSGDQQELPAQSRATEAQGQPRGCGNETQHLCWQSGFDLSWWAGPQRG